MEQGIAGLATFVWDLALGYYVALVISFAGLAFTMFALLRVTGVPISQNKYDSLYGRDEAYRKWREQTPMLVPKLSSVVTWQQKPLRG